MNALKKITDIGIYRGCVVKDETAIWYYVDDAGKRNGPCSQQKLLSLLFVEEISQSTLVWSAGMSEWAPLVEKFSLVTPPPVPEEAMPPSIPREEIDDNGMNYFLTLKGRADRQDYWALIFFVSLSYLAAHFLGLFWWAFVYIPNHPDVQGYMLGFVRDGDILIANIIVTSLIAWPCWVVAIKRWHDIDKSGWWSLLILIPFVGWVMAVVANGFISGTKGPNRFGEER
jgi:Predicted membrane protein